MGLHLLSHSYILVGYQYRHHTTDWYYFHDCSRFVLFLKYYCYMPYNENIEESLSKKMVLAYSIYLDIC